VRQRDRALGATLLQAELGVEITGGRLGRPLAQHEDTYDDDQRLNQSVLDETVSPQSPAPTVGEIRFRRDIVLHSRIKPCWSASKTASPRLWTSSLQ
jgi:hypothetical protein